MQLHHQHPWDLAPKEAIALQRTLAAHVRVADRFGEVRRVAGVDVGFEQNNTITRAAVAVLDFPALTLQEYAIACEPTRFPYIPGLLSFREVPAVLAALEQLSALPDMLLCDGQGIAHPRRLGIASHLGVLLDLPTIGVAKSRLVGSHEEPASEKGAWQPLLDKGEVIGCVLRSRSAVKPLYISPGHRVALESARLWVMACLTRYRLPETTRWAHRLASGPLLKNSFKFQV
jgi:deoxyribonuclease V